MARSPIKLLTWFEAIRWLLWKPSMEMSELSRLIGIRRMTTVRSIARTVRAALTEENANELLAGLDLYYARFANHPEPGDPS